MLFLLDHTRGDRDTGFGISIYVFHLYFWSLGAYIAQVFKYNYQLYILEFNIQLKAIALVY